MFLRVYHLMASVITPLSLVGRCNRTLVTAVSTWKSPINTSTQSWELPNNRSTCEGSLAMFTGTDDGARTGPRSGGRPRFHDIRFGPEALRDVVLSPWPYLTSSHGGHSRGYLGGFICIAAYTRLGPNFIPDPHALSASVDILGSTSARSKLTPSCVTGS